MEDDPDFRKLMGYFTEYHNASMQVSVCPTSSSFSRHIRLELPLEQELMATSTTPGWEPTVHLFVLKKDGADYEATHEALTAMALEQEAAAKAGEVASMTVSNKGGFHSHQALFQSAPRDKLLQRLKRKFMCAVAEAEASDDSAEELESLLALSPKERAAVHGPPTTSWLNVNRERHWNALHDHEGASWSGVYYVAVPPGAEPTSGRLVLRSAFGGFADAPFSGKKGKKQGKGEGEPRRYATDPKKPEGWCQFAYVDAAEGMIVLFPSWVTHGVMPLRAKRKGGAPRVSLAFNFGEPEAATPMKKRKEGAASKSIVAPKKRKQGGGGGRGGCGVQGTKKINLTKH